jgi:hypothetical protein
MSRRCISATTGAVIPLRITVLEGWGSGVGVGTAWGWGLAPPWVPVCFRRGSGRKRRRRSAGRGSRTGRHAGRDGRRQQDAQQHRQTGGDRPDGRASRPDRPQTLQPIPESLRETPNRGPRARRPVEYRKPSRGFRAGRVPGKATPDPPGDSPFDRAGRAADGRTGREGPGGRFPPAGRPAFPRKRPPAGRPLPGRTADPARERSRQLKTRIAALPGPPPERWMIQLGIAIPFSCASFQ